MIARNDKTGTTDIWTRLAQPVDKSAIVWRQDGKSVKRGDQYFARFVPYIEANTVRERLDSVVPGEWDLTLELLPPSMSGPDEDREVSFKARLQILGVIREDIGTGRDFKAAATDAFKRAGTRFGIGHELYAYEQNWVRVDSDSKFAKPLIDPGLVYEQRHSGGGGGSDFAVSSTAAPVERAPAPAKRQETSVAGDIGPGIVGEVPNDNAAPACPKCGGRMWDNRLSKRNPKAPDFKCRDRSCDGVVWPPKGGGGSMKPVESDRPAYQGDPGPDDFPSLDSSPLGMSLDDIPF